jgi:hypothetical protein
MADDDAERRLVAMIGLLDSPHEGERQAALLGLGPVLQRLKLKWIDIGQAVVQRQKLLVAAQQLEAERNAALAQRDAALAASQGPGMGRSGHADDRNKPSCAVAAQSRRGGRAPPDREGAGLCHELRPVARPADARTAAMAARYRPQGHRAHRSGAALMIGANVCTRPRPTRKSRPFLRVSGLAPSLSFFTSPGEHG